MKLLHAFALLGSTLAACAPTADRDSASLPGTLRVSVLPGQGSQELERLHAGLRAHLAAELGCEIELKIPDSYESLLESFERDELDLALFGGVTFVLAEERAGAIPIVMRDIDFEFTSVFIAGPDTGGNRLEDLAGRRFSFGPPLSTSGHVMPRHYLHEQDIEPEQLFSEVHYSKAHDATALAVRDGLIDVGVLDSVVLEAMLADGRLGPGDVRVLGFTFPYHDYVWACSPELSRGARDRVREAFLSLRSTDPAQAEVLTSLGAGYYLPASSRDFERLRIAVQEATRLGSPWPR